MFDHRLGDVREVLADIWQKFLDAYGLVVVGEYGEPIDTQMEFDLGEERRAEADAGQLTMEVGDC